MVEETPERTDRLTPTDLRAIAAITEDRLKSSSLLAAAAKKTGHWHTLLKFGVYVGALVVALFVFIQEVRGKPTKAEVMETVGEVVKPVRAATQANATKARENRSDLDDLKETTDRIDRVLDLSLDRDAWRDLVIEHIGQRRRGSAPPKPEELKKKEDDLMRGRRPSK